LAKKAIFIERKSLGLETDIYIGRHDKTPGLAAGVF